MIKTAQGKYRATVKDIQQNHMDFQSGMSGMSITNGERQSKKSSKQTVFSKYGSNIFGATHGEKGDPIGSQPLTAGFGQLMTQTSKSQLDALIHQKQGFHRHQSMHLFGTQDKNAKSNYFLELFHQKNQVNSKLVAKQTSHQRIKDVNYQIKFQKWLKQNEKNKKNDTLSLLKKQTSPKKGPIITLIKNSYGIQSDIGEAFKQNFKVTNPNPNPAYCRKKKLDHSKSQISERISTNQVTTQLFSQSDNQDSQIDAAEMKKNALVGHYSADVRKLYQPINRTINLSFSSMPAMS